MDGEIGNTNDKRNSVALEMKNASGQEITTQIATTSLDDEFKTDEMDIEGVVRLSLSSETQNFIGFVIQRKINPEVSWAYIAKETIEKHIASYKHESEFYKIHEAIKNFPGTEILLGCNASLELENQFYLCLTEKAEKSAKGILMRKKMQLENDLENTIHKQARPWVSLGSEKDVDDSIVKNTRPLVEKEIAISVSNEKMEICFQDEGPESLNNGYLACPGGSDILNIQRKRYSQAIQACPSVQSTSAQTNPGFPTNVWTHYEYEPQISSKVLNEELSKNKVLFQRHSEKIECMIDYNEKVDLYKNDYPQLIKNKANTQSPEEITYEEYETFIDIKRCFGKMISWATWHPSIPGVVAISYVRQPQFLYHQEKFMGENENGSIDKVLEDVYENNYVLVWSVAENFSPKLYLESPREVHRLLFSPDGNFLVAGLVNGQVVVWDLKTYLVGIGEESHILDMDTKNTRAIRAHLNWMKQKELTNHIAPCAISSLRLSHETCVTGIQWLPPLWHITESGEFEAMKGHTHSLEFMTCAHDGCVKFWDLNSKKQERPIRILSRKRKPKSLQKGPKTLSIPIITPHFKILTQNLEVSEQEKDLEAQFTAVALSIMAVHFIQMPPAREKASIKAIKQLTKQKIKLLQLSPPTINTTQKTSSDDETPDIKSKKDFKGPNRAIPKSEITVGTLDGAVTKLIWNDFDSDTEQTSGYQVASFAFFGDVHDGPVTSLVRSPFIDDLLLSIGGRIFAVWKESAKEALLYRRKFDVLITSGSWSVHHPSMFYIMCADGKMEVWDLFEKTDQCTFHQHLSGKLLTGVYPHPHVKDSLIGVADTIGQFRLLHVPSQHSYTDDKQIEKLNELIQRELTCKELFVTWQNNWDKKHVELLRARKEAAELQVKRQEDAEREEARKLREQKKKRQQEVEARKIKLAEIRAKTFTWKKDAEKKWKKEQEQYLIKTRLQQKKLDKEKLQQMQKPYILSIEEEKSKQLKLKETLGQKESLYKSAVQKNFPEFVQDEENTKSLLPDIMAEVERDILSTKSYEEVKEEALSFINTHPFEHQFNWINFMKEVHSRERCLKEGFIKGYLSSE